VLAHRKTKLLALWIFGIACVGVVACRSDESPPTPGFANLEDSSVSDRTVVFSDAGPISTRDAAVRLDAKSTVDAPSIDAKADTKTGVDASADALVAMTPRACNLLLQDCPANQSCYPFGNGGSRCEKPLQFGAPFMVCGGDNECAQGLVCVNTARATRQCSLLCDKNFLCAGNKGCLGLQGYNDVGYCNPN
jgi:hypothetical protein